MKIWYNNIIDTDRHVVEVQGDRIRIGRSPANEIVLDSPYVADEAAVLYRRNNGWELVALGMNGVTLGDRQLFGGERCDIRGSQTISLFPVFAHARSAESRGDHARASAAGARRPDVGTDSRYPRRAAAADGSHGRRGRDAGRRRRILAAAGANARQHRPQPRGAGQQQFAAGGAHCRLRPARPAAGESRPRSRPPAAITACSPIAIGAASSRPCRSAKAKSIPRPSTSKS